MDEETRKPIPPAAWAMLVEKVNETARMVRERDEMIEIARAMADAGPDWLIVAEGDGGAFVAPSGDK